MSRISNLALAGLSASTFSVLMSQTALAGTVNMHIPVPAIHISVPSVRVTAPTIRVTAPVINLKTTRTSVRTLSIKGSDNVRTTSRRGPAQNGTGTQADIAPYGVSVQVTGATLPQNRLGVSSVVSLGNPVRVPNVLNSGLRASGIAGVIAALKGYTDDEGDAGAPPAEGDTPPAGGDALDGGAPPGGAPEPVDKTASDTSTTDNSTSGAGTTEGNSGASEGGSSNGGPTLSDDQAQALEGAIQDAVNADAAADPTLSDDEKQQLADAIASINMSDITQQSVQQLADTAQSLATMADMVTATIDVVTDATGEAVKDGGTDVAVTVSGAVIDGVIEHATWGIPVVGIIFELLQSKPANMPNPDDGGPGNPVSNSGSDNPAKAIDNQYMPNPDDGSPGNPVSNGAAGSATKLQ